MVKMPYNRRKAIEGQILSCKNRSVLMELPTGYGKTLIALKLMAQRCRPKDNILIVIPRLVLKETWEREITKWGFEDYLQGLTFVTYMSFPKEEGSYKAIIFDEAHHITPRCYEALGNYKADSYLLLSATVGTNKENEFACHFPDLTKFKVSMAKAMDEGNIPTPEIVLVPLHLTPEQTTLYRQICGTIEYYKARRANRWAEKRWLICCKDRLVSLARTKEAYTKEIIQRLCKERMIIFCCDVKETETLSKFPVNSKSKTAENNINLFKQRRVSQISACDMLNEGVNLTECRIGIFNMINSSARLNVQKVGRILRHKKPILIFPYYVATREEEIIKGIVETYKDTAKITEYSIDNIQDVL